MAIIINESILDTSIVVESVLSNSEIFNGINELSGSNQKEKAINLIKTAKVLTKDDIEGAYYDIKRFPDSLSRAAIKAFDEGKIVLIHNEESNLSVTQAIPFLTFKRADGNITYIFTNKTFVTTSRDNILNIKTPILQDLFIGALIANTLKNNYSALATNQFLLKILMEVYTKFVCRILNKEYQIIPDKILYDTIQYWVNKFFALKIFETTDDMNNIENVTTKHFKYIDEMKFDEIRRQYDEKDPKNISELLDLIKESNPRMKTLGLGNFISTWINYFYLPSTLAIDNIEYLIFMVISLLRGSNFISLAASEIVKDAKGIKALKEELLKII